MMEAFTGDREVPRNKFAGFRKKYTPMFQAFCGTGGEKDGTVQRTVRGRNLPGTVWRFYPSSECDEMPETGGRRVGDKG